MSTQFIAVSGKMHSGKDTFGHMVAEEFGYYQHVNFADALKKGCAHLFGYSNYKLAKHTYLPDHGITVRQALQQLGTEVMKSHFGEDFWIRTFQASINEMKHVKCVLVTDVRFEAEYNWLRNRGALMIRMEGDPLGLRAKYYESGEQEHISETALDHYDESKWDYVVINNVPELDALKRKARKLVLNYRGK